MVKTVPAALQTHKAQDVTAFATAWMIERLDGTFFRFTNGSRDVTLDAGDGLGDQVYSAKEGFGRTNIANDSELNVGNLDVVGIFSGTSLNETELRRGLFDRADVKIMSYNQQSPTDGIIRMLRGQFAQVIVTTKGFFKVELRDLTQVFTREVGELYSKDCKADLGDARCRVPLLPDEVARSTAYAVGDFVRASAEREPIALTVTNPDAETGDVTGWTATVGSLDVRSSNPLPFEGSFYFDGGNNLETRANQVIAVPGAQETAIDAGERQYRLTWYQNSFAGSDDGEMSIEFLDGSMVSLGAAVASGLSAPTDWTERVIAGDTPANTRFIRIEMHMARDAGTNNDAYFDLIGLALGRFNDALIWEDFDDRVYECTTAGTTAGVQPSYDTIIDNTTTDGTAVFTARHSFMRFAEVSAVGSEARRIFSVTELTPNSGYAITGRTPSAVGFEDGFFNFGGVLFESGLNAGLAKEVRVFTADDGVTIVQDIELFEPMPFDISIGDKIRIFPGCDKVHATCFTRFNNADNIVAEPFVPGADILGQYPDAH